MHHQRLPFPDHHSIERVFAAVRAHLPAHIAPTVAIAPTTSKGLLPRIRTVLGARRQRGDVHHVTGDITFTGVLLPRRRTVLTVHDCEFLDRAGRLKGLVYRLFWLQLPCLRAAVVTVISPATADDLRRAVWRMPKDVRVVADPLPGGFTPQPPPANDPPVVLQMGTRPNKGVPEVVAAVAGTGWVLRTVGALDPEQRALIAASGVAHDELVGLSSEELTAAYAGSDVLVFAARHEGFGMPVIEAQATGRPVVAAERPPLPWVAGPGGAVLVDPTDPRAIRAALDAVLHDATCRDALVAAGLENVKRFAPETVAAQYAAIYEELAAR